MGGEALKKGISKHPLPAQRERHSMEVITLSHHHGGRLIFLLASWLLVWGFLFYLFGGKERLHCGK